MVLGVVCRERQHFLLVVVFSPTEGVVDGVVLGVVDGVVCGKLGSNSID